MSRFLVRCGAYILPLPSDISHLSSSIFLIKSEGHPRLLTIVDFFHDSAIHASLMALAAPEVYSFFLPLPWARKISLVGAQIFIFIDNATAVQGERGGELAWPSLSRSPQSPLASQLQRQRYKKYRCKTSFPFIYFRFI